MTVRAFAVTRSMLVACRSGTRPRRTTTASTLAAYLREIAKLPRLTVDEERELGAPHPATIATRPR